MNTTFLLSGGAGRIITAIPALEKFHKLNPQNDFKVLIHGWENLYWNHPILQQRTYGINQKGIFDLIVKNSNLVSPEPYHRWSYYNQKTSLVQAFDEEINNTNFHDDLDKPNLYLHANEIHTVKKLIQEAKQKNKKSKFIVYQPYGSGMSVVNDRPFDASGRSLDVDDALNLAHILAQQDAVVLYFGPNEYIHPKDDIMLNTKSMENIDLRFFMAMISQCDYFVGVDSVGQHMANSFDIPSTVILGSTFEKNITYPDKFNIWRNNSASTVYSPIRISGIDCDFADRINAESMKLTEQSARSLCESIIGHMNYV